MVTKAMYSISRNIVMMETSDGLLIPISTTKFKKDYPSRVRKKLLIADLNRQLKLQKKHRSVGLNDIANRQKKIITKIRSLMN